jgi:phospholipase C
MKFATRCLLPLFALATTFAQAQTIPQGTFQHIIIIVQENRTPDNLFGSAPSLARCGVGDPFEPGVDIDNGGWGYPPNNQGRQEICNISEPMNSGITPDHHYDDIPNHGYGWFHQYDSGGMDGFCEIVNNNQCQQYSYVQRSDVQPYFDIATAYGFANYMFQTNEGPSFPAHQMLFTGTSAPTGPTGGFGLDFAAENGANNQGCPDTSPMAFWVGPKGTEYTSFPQGWPNDCYTHDTLVTDVNGSKHFPWRYYLPNNGLAIWDAPAAISEICLPLNQNGQCSGGVYMDHVVAAGIGAGQGAPILSDIQSCALKDISWVIPDAAWSDHAGESQGSPPYGPSWVADVVDAVGNSTCTDSGTTYWNDTAIFIVWDDWGGWFDHVKPPNVYRGTDNPPSCTTAPNGWGCGNVYGFRVPLLVVSAYTKAGYVSGACTGNCPQKVFPYVHDFGSVLAFIEWNFSAPPNLLPFIAQPFYADYNAPDWSADHKTYVPLWDFFDPNNKRTFTSINTAYNAQFFEDYYANGHTPTGPDGGPDD